MSKEIKNVIEQYFKVGGWENPADWGTKNIDFGGNVGASMRRLDLEYSPFLVDPINAWDFSSVKRECTVVAPEQTGKTLCWLVGLLWSTLYKPCLSLVVYKSDDFATDMNRDKLLPLMKKIPSLANELAQPKSHRKDHYNFSTVKSYFQGSGSRISGKSAMICIADELDDWQEEAESVSNLDDMRKRSRSFDESMLYKVCSPRAGGELDASQIWGEFLAGSQGYWHLRCLKCDKLSIRSCDTHHLQFETEEDEHTIKIGSGILICPLCGEKHTEDMKPKMNRLGAYVHRKLLRIQEKPSFQWGCLASLDKDFCFDKVGQAQLDAGGSGLLKKQILFDNSFRGLPFKTRKKIGKYADILKSHKVERPADAEITHALMAVDTQDESFYYIIRVYDKNGNSYLYDCGNVKTIEELDEIWDKQVCGKDIAMGIIDAGGHRAQSVTDFTYSKNEFFMYKGRGQLAITRWEPSKNNKKLILVNPNIYKCELLYTMYGAENKGKNYWFTKMDLPKMYEEQMLDYHPDNKKRGGDKYSNWISTGNDHLFDSEKQCLVLNEMYSKALRIAKIKTEKGARRTAK